VISPTRVKSVIAAVLAVVALTWFGEQESVNAAVTTRVFQVGARVDVRCILLSNNLDFATAYVSGQVDPMDAVGSLYVDCDAGRRASVRLDQGLNPAPGSTARNPLRRVRNGTRYLNYNLFEDAAHTIVWDDQAPGVKTARAWPVTLLVYGRVYGGQTAYNGTYSDTVNARIFF